MKRCRSWLLSAAVGAACSLVAILIAFPIEAADSGSITPEGTVVDLDKRPLPDVQVTLHRWDGKFSPALETTTTDSKGTFAFAARPEDAYFYLVFQKPSFATISQTASTDGPAKATLLPAVETWLEVRSESGELLEGARIANISVSTPENPQSYAWRGMEHLFAWKFSASDEAGRLNLPPLPNGALVDIRIDHPKWAQAKISNVPVAEGRLSTVTLPAGVMTTFELAADPRTPVSVEGLTVEAMVMAGSSSAAATINRLPMTVKDGRLEFCAHPATYDYVQLKSDGVVITPNYGRSFDSKDLKISSEKRDPFRFLVRKTVDVTGRVIRSDGSPHKGARVYGQIENLTPEGAVPDVGEWAYAGFTETDSEGRFTSALPPGKTRMHVDSKGFVINRVYTEFTVVADGPNVVPDFTAEKLEPLRGRVALASGGPAAGAIVRARHSGSIGLPPAVCDESGVFEIALPGLPTDSLTMQRTYELEIAAFVPDEPLIGRARIDLRDKQSLQKIEIKLQPEASPDDLFRGQDIDWLLAARAKRPVEDRGRHPAGAPGQPAPELDGSAWFNTDARSLKDFRGRYVLLDFWFIGCGPCHYDFPSVKLVHERFEKHGVTVIGVHNNSSTPDAVREHCKKEGLTFPIVVDHPDKRIWTAYRELGISGAPGYLLIGPDGNIVENDRVTDNPSLRSYKLEIVRKYVLQGRK